MPSTPNHSYNKPSEGATNWHIPLNENFEQIDIDVEIRGKEENKSDYDPKVGAKYEATDSGAIYYGNGDTWILADRRVDRMGAETVAAKQLQENGPLLVSPSIEEGYDSLQTALNDAADGVGAEIWLMEDIVENVVIKADNTGVGWFNRDGLTIRGMSGGHTDIKDNQRDGTPIIDVEDANADKLRLDGLSVTPDGVNTRAVSQARFEEGTGGSLTLAHFCHCRFYAPVIISKVYHSYFENCGFIPRVGTTRDKGKDLYDKPIYPGLMLNAGNQYMFDRCQFVDKTGKTRYGTCWLSGANSALLNQCFFTKSGVGYDDQADRPTAPLLIDTGGDIVLNLPYTEQGMDYAMVTDAIEGGGNAIDNIRINGSRLGGIKLNNYVNGFVINHTFQQHTLDLTTGIAGEGSYVNTTYPTGIDIVGENSKYLRVYSGRSKGWKIDTPPLPVDDDSTRRNKKSVPVLIYQSNASGTKITDFHGNTTTIPDDSGPIMLGLNETVTYETSYPDEWAWYGME